jgi:UDP-glucose 4-epimerase
MEGKKKILVTGGSGYIGAHTAVELIEAGYETVIVDNFSRSDDTLLNGMEKILKKKPVFIEGDCTSEKFLNEVFKSHGPFSAVLHFAAYKSVGESVAEPLLYYENNVQSLVALLKVMRQHKVTDLIFSSSCTVYGQPDQIPVAEHAPFKRAESPYGSSKQMCERILEDIINLGFKVISLRYFNPIGAHPSAMIGELPIGSPNNLVPYITQTAAGVRKELVIFGRDYNTPDGTCIRDFIHVVDLAKAHVQALRYLLDKPQNALLEVFNLGTGIGISVLQVVKEFIDATQLKLNYRFGDRRPGDVEKVFADPAKANQVLGWRTEYSLRDSLLHAWAWEKRIRNI